MFDWVWLIRILVLGVGGTAALATWFSTNIFNQSEYNRQNNRSSSTAAITKKHNQAKKLTVTPTPLPQGEQKIVDRQVKFDLKQNLATYTPLFATPVSLGMLAIGAAEGNYRVFAEDGTLYVQQTPSYFGHTDPGNLTWGEVVTNYGPCSDQGRSGGDIALAEKLCLERSRSELPTHLSDLFAAGINPGQDLEALLNTADLYNQAKPIHARKFPQALAIAQKGGLEGVEALAWARTASFYLNSNNELDVEAGTNQANGLIGICAQQQRVTTEWQCVYEDQLRRVEAITAVLNQYRLVSQDQG